MLLIFFLFAFFSCQFCYLRIIIFVVIIKNETIKMFLTQPSSQALSRKKYRIQKHTQQTNSHKTLPIISFGSLSTLDGHIKFIKNLFHIFQSFMTKDDTKNERERKTSKFMNIKKEKVFFSPTRDDIEKLFSLLFFFLFFHLARQHSVSIWLSNTAHWSMKFSLQA